MKNGIITSLGYLFTCANNVDICLFTIMFLCFSSVNFFKALAARVLP